MNFRKIGFLVCVKMVLVHLAFRYVRVSKNFVSRLFLPQKSLISAQASVITYPTRVPKYPYSPRPIMDTPI